MALKKHHKIILGTGGSVLIIFMIVVGVLTFTLFTRQEYNRNLLENQIEELQADTQGKINELTEVIIKTQTSVSSINDSFNMELADIKATATEDFSEIIDDAIKSVVTIKTDISQGTGFIIKEQGYVVTNYHVVSGATAAGVFTYDGDVHSTQLIGFNELLDIALLKIAGTFEEINLGDSDDVEIGEKVIAIGNPLGLQFSVSEGIVSATDREGSNGIEAYIQTDAALNPGNSGGPLINKQGEVIGINNFKVSGGENLGFALEADTIRATVNEISELKLNQTLV
jgi:S1-C subfamily serine protease